MNVAPFLETRALSGDDHTVGLARHFVVDALRSAAWDEDHLGVIALLTTELATNAVVHVGSPYSVTIYVTERVVRVDVIDESSTRPVVTGANRRDAEGGRGLLFLDVMADAWGVDDRRGGKSVWFELRR